MAEGASSHLTVKDVQNELHEINNWYLLGIQLGVDTSKLDQFEANHRGDVERCKVDVVQHWLSNVDIPTWRSLADAVQRLGGRTRLVQTLQGKALQESPLETAVSSNGTSNGEIAEVSAPECITNGHSNGVTDSENLYTACMSERPFNRAGHDELDESDLKVETQKVMLKFGALVTNVKLTLKSQGVTVEAFASHLMTIKGLEPVYVQSQTPLLEACIKEVRAQQSIFAAVDVISDYFSWFNHMLIENIIETFCKHNRDIKERLREFREQFHEYCNHRICKCPRNGFGSSRKKNAALFVVKVDAKWDTARVDQLAFIRDTIANILHVKRQALYLRTVDNGCIQLAFLVPEYIADVILPLAVNPREQAAALSRAGVLELHCRNLSFYFYTTTGVPTSSGHVQAVEDDSSSLTTSDLSNANSDSSDDSQEETTNFQKPTTTNALEYGGQQQSAPAQAAPLHRTASTNPSNGRPECSQCSSRAKMEKGLMQTLSDALCKIDALHLERDSVAIELTTLQQDVEHERKLIHRRLFGNEKANHGLSATLQRIDVLQQERDSLAIKLDVLHHRMLEKQQSTEFEKKMIQNKLFGLESSDQTLSEIVHRIDVLLHERHSLAAEVETLQHSSTMLLERLQGIKHERKLLHKKLFGDSWGHESADQTLGDTLHKIDVLHQEMDTLRQASSNLSEQLRTLQSEQKATHAKLFGQEASHQSLTDTLEKIDALQQEKESLATEVGTLRQDSRQLLGQLQSLEHEKKEVSRLLFGQENADKSLADILHKTNALQQERDSLHAAIASLQRNIQSEWQRIHERLFGQAREQEDAECRLGNTLQKIDTLHQEKDTLAREVDRLQRSSGKLLEELTDVKRQRQEINRKLFGQERANTTLCDQLERIDLLTKERDDLAMEIHTLRGLRQEVVTLSSRLIQTEQERDRISAERARLELQVAKMKMTESNLIKEHAESLERSKNSWTQKWPRWTESWEEKSVSIPLGTDRLAGFSVVGGRDQPHMPNPGAFIVTAVDVGSPASGVLQVGDILETVNGVNLSYAEHREAANAVQNSVDVLNIVLHRRKHVYPIQAGVVSSINSTPQLEADPSTEMEQIEISLNITGREKLGFCYDWSSTYTVTDVSPSGPASLILQPGDRIIKVNNVPVVHDKPSAVKKIMKPHNKTLRLVIERQKSVARPDKLNLSLKSHETQKLLRTSMPPEGGPFIHQLHSFRRSFPLLDAAQPLQDLSQQDSKTKSTESFKSRCSVPNQPSSAHVLNIPVIHQRSMSDGPTHSKRRIEYEDVLNSGSQFSQDSKTKSTEYFKSRHSVPNQPSSTYVPDTPAIHQRSMSDAPTYSERIIDYEDISNTDSQCSQSQGHYSSNGSIDLIFHTTPVSYNSLTVDSVMTTQSQLLQSPHADDKKFTHFCRDDVPSNPDSGVGSSPCSGRSQSFGGYGHSGPSPSLAPSMTSVMKEETSLATCKKALDTRVAKVEVYTGKRPVMVFGALADQVVASLLEKSPHTFYPCPTVKVTDLSHNTETCLMLDLIERKIVDFWKTEAGYEMIKVESFITGSKDKHCLLTGTILALRSLVSIAPPISILIKTNSKEYVRDYSTKRLLPDQAREVYEKTKSLEEQHGHEFSASLFLTYMDTLTSEVKRIVKQEKRKKVWVPEAEDNHECVLRA